MTVAGTRPSCDSNGWGSEVTGTASCNGVCGITIATGAGEIGDGSGTAVDGLKGSELCQGAGGTGGGGGGLGSAVAETRLRFVAMTTCGTVIGPVCVMAI